MQTHVTAKIEKPTERHKQRDRWSIKGGLLVALAFSSEKHCALCIQLRSRMDWIKIPRKSAGEVAGTSQQHTHYNHERMDGSFIFLKTKCVVRARIRRALQWLMNISFFSKTLAVGYWFRASLPSIHTNPIRQRKQSITSLLETLKCSLMQSRKVVVHVINSPNIKLNFHSWRT